MLKYSKFINTVKNTKLDNQRDIRKIFDDALNFEYNGVEKPLEIREQNIQRIMVNTIRHSYSNYDIGLKQIYKLKSEDMYFRYKNIILEQISNQYPYLKDECNKQKHIINMANIISG